MGGEEGRGSGEKGRVRGGIAGEWKTRMKEEWRWRRRRRRRGGEEEGDKRW